MQRQDRLTWRVMSIGRSLAATTNSADVVALSPPLQEALARFLGSEVVEDHYVQQGDEPPPLGDGTASHRLFLLNKKGECLAIRLRIDSVSAKVPVLGFTYLDANAVRAIPKLDALMKDIMKFESSIDGLVIPVLRASLSDSNQSTRPEALTNAPPR